MQIMTITITREEGGRFASARFSTHNKVKPGSSLCGLEPKFLLMDSVVCYRDNIINKGILIFSKGVTEFKH